MSSRYVVGIDLGTTNTVVAWADAQQEDAGIRLFEIEQLVAPGEVATRPMLPSLRYHPAPGEFADGDLGLPWSWRDPAGLPQAVIGQLARARGAQVPGRLVASAKSWLSHAAVDRGAAILPWGAEAEVPKVSPVAASASYLAYVRAAWNARHPDAPLERQQVVLTVPASFDEGARMLTLQAARDAGLPDVRLLEEPQAAFYDWLHRHRDTLDAELADTRLVLVVDVGGGTTDLTLIRVEPGKEGEEGAPQLTRIGVGNHLMLGGDNMDLALAHLAEQRLGGGDAPGARLSASRMSQLIERCRAAKEQLLAADAPERAAVTLLGAGSRLVGGARTVELAREEVERLVVDGFFPRVAPTEPVRRARAGLVEFGLPYAADAAVTRHVGSFLMRHAADSRLALGLGEGGAALPVPDTLLLNGGVFRADALARRLQQTLADWRGAPLRLLHNDNPDVAVARGAVAFSLARRGRAPRIGGGSARSYFLLLDDVPRDAAAGSAARGVCVLPRGSEEGRELRLQERTFALRLGRPVRFHLASTTAGSGSQADYRLGELVALDEGEFVRLPPIATVVAPGAAGGRREVPVQLATTLTEVGTLEVDCVGVEDPAQRWSLEFQLRGEAGEDAAESAAAGAPPGFGETVERIERVFGARSQQVAPKEVKQLRAQLEALLGARERWPTPLLRRLFDALWQRAKARRRSADHERVWLNLAGFCLRPGFGDPLDGWRIEQLWTLFEAGVQHGHDAQVASEWWTLWRRVAGGLPEEAQLRLLDDFAWNLQGAEAGEPRPPRLVKGGFDDMIRLGASLERIPAEHKAEIGEWLLGRLHRPVAGAGKGEDVDGRLLWAVGRIGARQPFYGSAHGVVPADTAAQWLETLLALDWRRVEAAAFAAAHLARMTGDRTRDIAPELRERVVGRLSAAHAAPSWIAMVREVVQLDEATERRVFGEALPPGLKLIA
ncbi:Hsp70 family protein [Caldimonas tepidiphila]|uniref:Hsp70 family protein n=1 Tax=Caldimonas tepidiphila TaxID=2315841 RepID=UPI000E5C30E2|nr:Hsp70 family protein [Caldimonas tepidiphila]